MRPSAAVPRHRPGGIYEQSHRRRSAKRLATHRRPRMICLLGTESRSPPGHKEHQRHIAGTGALPRVTVAIAVMASLTIPPCSSGDSELQLLLSTPVAEVSSRLAVPAALKLLPDRHIGAPFNSTDAVLTPSLP